MYVREMAFAIFSEKMLSLIQINIGFQTKVMFAILIVL